MFDIQEHALYVHPVVETVQFAEADYTKKKVRNYWDEGKSNEFVNVWIGQPLAVYPIVSHFDVIRSYNPSTGKQSNVLVENTTDRPWYDRDFIRVNWSQQKLPSLTFLVNY